jgi:nucleoside-diphosphate-sugar epimerase
LKILVTGNSGFVGRYVVSELKSDNQHFIVGTSDTNASADDVLVIRKFNLTSFDPKINYYEYFDKPDVLIHLAWLGLPDYNDEIHMTQVQWHVRFLENLLENGLKKVVVTGTCQEYGKQEGCLKEDMEIFPATKYAIGKNNLRLALKNLKERYNFQYNWIRLFYMYGKGQSPKAILSLLEKSIEEKKEVFNMSPGDQLRDYLPVEKVAEYIVKIALQSKYSGVINCCSGIPITIKSLVENYLKKNNRTMKLNTGYYSYPDYEPFAFWGNNELLKSILF